MKKPPKCRSQDFFHSICLWMCLMARTAFKQKHMASKFIPGVKMMKKSQRNNYLLKKLSVMHFFLIIANWFFQLCKNYQVCAIIEYHIAHDLFNYCTLILCIYIPKKLEWIFKKSFQTTNADLDSLLISKVELFVTIINGFYQIFIVSYKSIIDITGALYHPRNR